MESDQNLSQASRGKEEEKHAVPGDGGRCLKARAADNDVNGGADLIKGGVRVPTRDSRTTVL
jgi:hypothetical protein